MITRELKIKDRCWVADYLTNKPLELEVIEVLKDNELKCLELRSSIENEKGYYITVILKQKYVYETKEEALKECNEHIREQVKKLTEDLSTPEKLMEALIEAKVRINYKDRDYHLTTDNMEHELKILVKKYFDVEV